MIKMQSIKTPAGEELVVMPRAEFDRLLAAVRGRPSGDDPDAIAARDTMARIDRGEEETFPHEIAKRLRKGEDHPIKVFREYRGLTQEKLAIAAGIHPQYVWQLEHGRAKAGEKTRRRLARILEIDSELLRRNAARA